MKTQFKTISMRFALVGLAGVWACALCGATYCNMYPLFDIGPWTPHPAQPPECIQHRQVVDYGCHGPGNYDQACKTDWSVSTRRQGIWRIGQGCINFVEGDYVEIAGWANPC